MLCWVSLRFSAVPQNAKLLPPDGGAENQTAKNQSEGATVSTDLTLSSQDFRSRCKMFVTVALHVSSSAERYSRRYSDKGAILVFR